MKQDIGISIFSNKSMLLCGSGVLILLITFFNNDYDSLLINC